MNFNLTIPTELVEDWKPVIEHQFNLTLSPLVAASLGTPRVDFQLVEEKEGPHYRCVLRARLRNGTPVDLSGQHPDGRTAISSVFHRARRQVTRRRRSLNSPAGIRRRDAPAPLP